MHNGGLYCNLKPGALQAAVRLGKKEFVPFVPHHAREGQHIARQPHLSNPTQRGRKAAGPTQETR